MTDLKAKDIVEATNGEVSYSAAGKWLKKENPSLSVRMALKFIGLWIGASAAEKDIPVAKAVKTPAISGKIPITKATKESFDGAKMPITHNDEIMTMAPSGKKVEKKSIIEQVQPHVESIQKSFTKIKEFSTERSIADPSIPVAMPCNRVGKDMTCRRGSLMSLPALFFTIGTLGYFIRDMDARSFSVNRREYLVSEFQEVD